MNMLDMVSLADSAEALHRHQHRAADDRRAGGLADVERELIRIRIGERRATKR